MRTLIAAAALLLSTTTLAAATHEALFTMGRQAFREGDADKAVELFEEALKQQPGNAGYHYWLGSAYGRQAVRSNMLKQALLAKKLHREYERAVELDPHRLDARWGLIDFYTMAPGFMGGDVDKALHQAAEIKKRDLLAGHRAYARVYFRQKKADLARKQFDAVLTAMPGSAEAHYHFSGFLLSEKNYKESLAAIETSLGLDPSFMPAYFRLGQLSALAGNNFRRGETALRQYLAYQPGDEEPSLGRAWFWLGMIYEKEGRKAEAKQSYQTALRLMPGAAKEIAEALRRVS